MDMPLDLIRNYAGKTLVDYGITLFSARDFLFYQLYGFSRDADYYKKMKSEINKRLDRFLGDTIFRKCVKEYFGYEISDVELRRLKGMINISHFMTYDSLESVLMKIDEVSGLLNPEVGLTRVV